MFAECPCCKKIKKLQKYRRLTQYHNDEVNWITCCKGCKKQDDEHWNAMWKDSYEYQGFGGCYDGI